MHRDYSLLLPTETRRFFQCVLIVIEVDDFQMFATPSTDRVRQGENERGKAIHDSLLQRSDLVPVFPYQLSIRAMGVLMPSA
jgi:hypothetical protein